MEKRLAKRIRTVTHILGVLVIMEACFMLVCALPGYFSVQWDSAVSMLKGGVLTLVTGLVMYLPSRKKDVFITQKDACLIVTLIWLIFSLLGCTPYLFGGYLNTFPDAFFETMSGFTCTGASVINDVEALPYSIGLWRIMTEWIGGIGIIVIILSVVPMVGGGGMALYSAEVAGPSKSKVSPHIKETANVLMVVYLVLTLVYFGVYMFCGMSLYDAVCTAFTTVATGGLSNRNASAAAFPVYVQYIIACFMLVSGCNLLLIYSAFKGRFRAFRESEEFRTYIFVVVIAVIVIMILTWEESGSFSERFSHAFFMVSSIITSTGLVNYDITLWPTAAVCMLIILMIFGAMSGSTTGGLKLVRMIILFKNAFRTLREGVNSKVFSPVKLDGRPVSTAVQFNVFNVFLLYMITFAVGYLLLVFHHTSLEEAAVAAVSMLSNMGVGYGSCADGCYVHFTQGSRMVLALMMLAGRLELVTVWSIFTRSFWKD